MKTLKIKSLLLALVAFTTVGAVAQGNSGRTVTNADMEKYRNARVKADEDYRQNYEKRGMPSPEELERRETDRQKRFAEASNELREQRLNDEYNEYVRAAADYSNAQRQQQVVYVDRHPNYGSYGGGFYVSNPYWGNRRKLRASFGGDTGFGPNVQMVKDAASMFPNADSIRNNNIFRRGTRPRR